MCIVQSVESYFGAMNVLTLRTSSLLLVLGICSCTHLCAVPIDRAADDSLARFAFALLWFFDRAGLHPDHLGCWQPPCAPATVLDRQWRQVAQVDRSNLAWVRPTLRPLHYKQLPQQGGCHPAAMRRRTRRPGSGCSTCCSDWGLGPWAMMVTVRACGSTGLLTPIRFRCASLCRAVGKDGAGLHTCMVRVMQVSATCTAFSQLDASINSTRMRTSTALLFASMHACSVHADWGFSHARPRMFWLQPAVVGRQTAAERGSLAVAPAQCD